MAPDETHDAAVAAPMAIRGLTLSQAESLLRDGGLPADPFAP